MPNKTKIEWTDYTSNPIVPVGGGWGCSKVSPGCDSCYAERLNKWRGNKRDFAGRWEFELKRRELKLLERLPPGKRTFVCDMTDLFHRDIPWLMIEELFKAMALNPEHTFQVLTKRPGRMAYFANHLVDKWPENVWAGVSIDSQKYVQWLDVLARVPAKVRFVSYEPALGPVDFRPWLPGWNPAGSTFESPRGTERYDIDWSPVYPVDWVIAGGESGPRARPAHPDWFRGVRDQCHAAGVPFFFKSWGQWEPAGYPVIGNAPWTGLNWLDVGGSFPPMVRLDYKPDSAFLYGRECREFPVG